MAPKGKATAAAPAAEPAKKVKKEKVPDNRIKTKQLADSIGVKPAALRRYLRSLPAFKDGTYTRYAWEPGDPFLKDVKARYEKFAKEESEKNKERLAKLKGKGAKGKGKAKKSEEEEGDEAQDLD